MDRLIIRAVEIEVVRGSIPPAEHANQQQVRAIDIYDEHRHAVAPAPPTSDIESLYLHIGCEGGVDGLYGPVDRAAAWPIVDSLADVLVGQDALAGTIVWDKLSRFDRHSRQGLLKMAISAIDNALWDVRGNAFGAPVWQLLGGASRSRIPAYASTLGFSHEGGAVESAARELAAEGYAGQKWFFAHGPAEGWEGLRRNIELIERLRDVLGPGVDLMFDAWMGWDLSYARSWAQAVEQLRPRWLEEPFALSHDALFAELHRATSIPLAAGEHLYDRRQVLQYLEQGCLSVLQMDPEWCGGVTDLSRMCAIAETFGIPVVPHGHRMHAALHVVASQSPETCPLLEYLLHLMPRVHHFELDPPRPRGGYVDLPTAPGFGIRLDPAKIESRETWIRR